MAGAGGFDDVAFGALACQRSSSGLIVRSLPATNIQVGFVGDATAVMVAAKLSARLRTCERTINAA